ncbi:Flagellar basal-body rod protein FlgG [Symmachiella macrocystis]|uniref:Flagellar basal-body rod protein FlgG n=1 Tax=Symmachiella macrocystis TaxID=2527985 RepID=A0A5C6BIV3_9PLAN|nr:flagellar basal-body rod protein FlgG [Symmachiella macrocystis]TWU11607.1 Flagellar basal-body rod protein FlgG [Symmachiella macrocystis]
MLRALNSSATGMQAQAFNLDVIANNLANADTTAFKSSRANFEDTYYEQVVLPGQQNGVGQRTAVGQAVGLGTRIQSTQLDFSQGALQATERPLDLAITGPGFFQVLDQNRNQIMYTRAGNITKNVDGQLVMASSDIGRPLDPSITIPQDATNIAISSDGVVSVLQPGNPDLQQVGQLQLSRFINPEGLVQVGDNLYQQSAASGTPIVAFGGQDGMGVVRSGFLEKSNVEPVKQLVGLIRTQRAFELASQAIQVADEQLSLVANLRRF